MNKKGGFSLLEVLIVVGIGMAITAIALPSFTTAIANAKLRGSMTSLSGLLQNCRMIAVKQNKTMTAKYEVRSNGLVGFIKKATDDSGLSTTDSQVEMEAPIDKMITPTGPGAPAGVTSAVLGFTAATGDVLVSFNSRGLPCLFDSGTCPNSGFVQYFKDTRIAGNGGWAAISVSPAGRIKRWFWNGAAWTD
jgi:Tfp pilus assembly protein FimT